MTCGKNMTYVQSNPPPPSLSLSLSLSFSGMRPCNSFSVCWYVVDISHHFRDKPLQRFRSMTSTLQNQQRSNIMASLHRSGSEVVRVISRWSNTNLPGQRSTIAPSHSRLQMQCATGIATRDLKNSTPTPKIWQPSSTTIFWTITCMRTTVNVSSIQRLLTFRMPSWNSRIVLNQYMSGADPGDCNWIRRKQNWFGLDQKPVWRRLFILIWTCISELTS